MSCPGAVTVRPGVSPDRSPSGADSPETLSVTPEHLE
jgi:hypothetical protein